MYGPDELMKQLSFGVTRMGVLVGLLGGNSAAARAISGSSDKKSAEYKAALRNVQRYQKAEQPGINPRTGKPFQPRGGMRGAAKMKSIRTALANALRKEKLNAEASGVLVISKIRGWRAVRTQGFEPIAPAAVDAMLDAFIDGDGEKAFAAFEYGIIDAYGQGRIDGAQYEDADVDFIDLHWG